MRHLLLTLGHNSSAILVEDGEIKCGYEEERLTGVKSDSRFPIRAIEQVMGKAKPDAIYCTHWEPSADVMKLNLKYWDPSYAEGIPVRSHTDNTHHDTHAHAAWCFATRAFPIQNAYILIADGFGSFGEHLSLYQISPYGDPHLVFRAHGYDTSLGLMYQYATAFLGMKMHEDEYKLLGYEVHIDPNHADKLHQPILDYIHEWYNKISNFKLGSVYDPMFNLEALAAVREHFFKQFSQVLDLVKLTDPTTFEARTVLAYFVQSVLEGCIIRVLSNFTVENLVVSGGCFYNVKLNKILLEDIPGKFCAYPLAGDQGNAIGLYAMDHPSFRFPKNLFWGQRKLESAGVVEGLHYVSRTGLASSIRHFLNQYGFVNLVRGHMEFGPRALCNTSTLAMPTLEVVETINKANNRNTVMPMAPVMTRPMYKACFKHADRVWKSEQYMILALEYHEKIADLYPGAAHRYKFPFYSHSTGRPQVIGEILNDPVVDVLLTKGPLINTSFNYHGKPIAFDMPSVIENHQLQRVNNPNFNTLVVTD